MTHTTAVPTVRPASDAMAPVIHRRDHRQFVCTVSQVLDLCPTVRRITLHAKEFTTFTCCGPDEYFGLMMPRRVDDASDRRAPLVIPHRVTDNVRQAIAELPETIRPDLRWYTVAAHRPELSEIDVEIVMHGDAGPGSAWACRAAVGDRVGFRSGGALYHPRRPDQGLADRQLLVADETALPALRAIHRQWAEQGGRGRIELHLEVPSLTALGGPTHLPAGTVVHERGGDPSGSAVLPALQRRRDLGDTEYAWVCGEAAMVARVRRHLVRKVGMPRETVLFSGYWKHGSPRP